MATDQPEFIVARTLKTLYPNNPDVVLGREARIIVAELRAAGVQFLVPIVQCGRNTWCEAGDGHKGVCVQW